MGDESTWRAYAVVLGCGHPLIVRAPRTPIGVRTLPERPDRLRCGLCSLVQPVDRVVGRRRLAAVSWSGGAA